MGSRRRDTVAVYVPLRREKSSFSFRQKGGKYRPDLNTERNRLSYVTFSTRSRFGPRVLQTLEDESEPRDVGGSGGGVGGTLFGVDRRTSYSPECLVSDVRGLLDGIWLVGVDRTVD